MIKYHNSNSINYNFYVWATWIKHFRM